MEKSSRDKRRRKEREERGELCIRMIKGKRMRKRERKKDRVTRIEKTTLTVK
jgi:hypothetical protein